MNAESDREQLRQTVREMVWEVLDGEIFPLLKDFAATRLEVERNPPPSPEKKEPTATIPESMFATLRFEDQKGEKLGEFQVAYRGKNDGKTWDTCFNLLKDRKATIQESFHPPGYLNKYWLYLEPGYDNRIFRKHLEAGK
jgi:hypothetical protein